MTTHVQRVISGKQPRLQVEDEVPYSAAQESSVYLDPTARAELGLPDVAVWWRCTRSRQAAGDCY